MTDASPAGPAQANPAPDLPGSAAGPGAGELQRLDPRAIMLWRLAHAGRGAMFAGIALAAELVLEPPFPAGLLALAIALLTAAVVALLAPAQHRAWGYRLRSSDLFLRHGVLIRTTSIVPHARIQHVDTRHGPLQRFLGLADVVVFTAGTRGAILTIPALDAATAEALRDRLIALSGAGDAV